MANLKLTEARVTRVARYLSEQFGVIEPARRSRSDRIRSYVARYEAKTTAKNFPFRGASNVHIPLVAEIVDSIKARITNALRAQPDAFVEVQAPIGGDEEIPGLVDPATGRPATWRLIAELFEEYLLFEIGSAGQINMLSALDTFIDDMLMNGTGWLVPIWATDVEMVFPEGAERAVEKTTFDNVRFLNPTNEDVDFPPHYDSMERIPLWSRKYRARPSEILQRVDSGDVKGFNAKRVKALLDAYVSNQPKVEDSIIERLILEGAMDPTYYASGDIEMRETWLRFVLDPSDADAEAAPDAGLTRGFEVPIVVDHAADDPRHIVRIMPWPYAHRKIPAVKSCYIARRSRMEGMGIPERLESLDEALSTNTNQMFDNATIANMRIWAARGDDTIEALADLYPNKMIPVSEPGDLQAMQAGDVYASGFEIHNIVRDHSERVSKVTDYNLGRESSNIGKQGTATTTLALLQESNQYFDTITRNARTALNEGYNMTRDLIVQHKPIARIREVLGKRGELLLSALLLPPEDFGKRISIVVSFSTTAATRELQRQEEQAKLQVIDQYYMSLVQLAQLRFGDGRTTPPATPPIAVLCDMIGKDAHNRRVVLLESYGERSSASLLPDWEKVKVIGDQWIAQQQQLAKQQAALGGAQGGEGAGAPTEAGRASGANGAGGDGGLASVLQAAGAQGGGGAAGG